MGVSRITNEEIIRLLKIEHTCSQSNCDRNCSICSLVQEQQTLDKMYKRAIQLIKENAELKAQIEKMKCCQNCERNCAHMYGEGCWQGGVPTNWRLKIR